MRSVLRLCFSWEYIGPHHRARVRACVGRNPAIRARAFALTDLSSTYGFYSHDDNAVDIVVAYRSKIVEKLNLVQRMRAYIRHIWFSDDDVYFLCHYERFEVFLTAIILRLRGKRVFVMNDSKFDDYQRYIRRELLKSLLYKPYCGALVSGIRSASYLSFLGVRGKIEIGYDTIDVQLVSRRMLDRQNIKPSQNYFIAVNRLVKRKNVELIIRAFHGACREIDKPINLLIVGEGPEETPLRALTHLLGIEDKVRFIGNIPNDEVVSLIAPAVALVLVSTSEQWGLVINEALACGVPVIVSDNVGARDSLVRSFVNGYVIESNNELGLARAMLSILRHDQQFATPDAEMYAASVERFADAVWSLLEVQ
jgi:L-malate glycosyltransferase